MKKKFVAHLLSFFGNLCSTKILESKKERNSSKTETKFCWKRLFDPPNLLFSNTYNFSKKKNISKRHSLFKNFELKWEILIFLETNDLGTTLWKWFSIQNKINKNWCENACHYRRTKFGSKKLSFFFKKMKKKLIFWKKNWQNWLFYHNWNEKL